MTEQAEPTAINSKSDADWLLLCFYSKPWSCLFTLVTLQCRKSFMLNSHQYFCVNHSTLGGLFRALNLSKQKVFTAGVRRPSRKILRLAISYRRE